MKKTIILALALVGITTAAWASDPLPLASGVIPKYPLQTWNLPNGTIGAQVGGEGGLTYIRGVSYSWPTVTAAGTLINDGSGNLLWTNGAVVSATLPLSIANGGSGASTVAAAKAALGFQSASASNGTSTNYTWTFSPAYSTAPVVVASPNQNVNVWISSVSTSQAVITATATNLTLYLRAVGAP